MRTEFSYLMIRTHTLSVFTLLLATVFVSNNFAQEKKLTAKEAQAMFDRADQALNEAWATVKKELPESEFITLKDAQRTWVEHRDYLARSPIYTGTSYEGELPLDSPDYLEAAAGLAEMRTDWLKGLARVWETDEALTGMWTDSYGGSIEIVERERHLHFVMQCVRGPSSHLGGLAGIAVWNQTIGWFSDKGRDNSKTEETNVSFILRGSQLEVIGANTGDYHGARAYFDGSYVKVGPLKAKAQAKIIKAAQAGDVPME